MNYLIVIALSVLLLTGCAGGGQSSTSASSPSAESMGQVVREVSAYGFITQISVSEQIVNIKHAPIPELNWAPMVMDFSVKDGVDLSSFKRGDKVQFTLEVDQALNYRIKQMTRWEN